MKKTLLIIPLVLILAGAVGISVARGQAHQQQARQRQAQRAAMLNKDLADSRYVRSLFAEDQRLMHPNRRPTYEEMTQSDKLIDTGNRILQADINEWEEDVKRGGPASDPGPPPPFNLPNR